MTKAETIEKVLQAWAIGPNVYIISEESWRTLACLAIDAVYDDLLDVGYNQATREFQTECATLLGYDTRPPNRSP